jgi:hypothetical protein
MHNMHEGTLFLSHLFTLMNHEQEHLSAKQEELYKAVQVKAAISSQTQLLLDMKVSTPFSQMYRTKSV